MEPIAALVDPTLSRHDARIILRLIWTLDELRAIYPKFTANQMCAFLTVASSPGFGPTEYAKMMRVVQPAASTLLLQLGPKGRDGVGLGLLNRRQDPKSLRQIEYHLTPSGHALALKAVALVTGKNSDSDY